MSILEGIGFNIPIVTTPVGGIPQIVQDKKWCPLPSRECTRILRCNYLVTFR